MNHDTIRLFKEGHSRKTDTTNIMRESKKMAHLLFLSPFAARSGLMHSRDNFNFWRHSNSTTQFLYHTIFLLYGYYFSYDNIIVHIIWEKSDIGALPIEPKVSLAWIYILGRFKRDTLQRKCVVFRELS